MTETIHLGDIEIYVTRKSIKHVHLSVHPPTGRVTVSAPLKARLDIVRAYAVSKLKWILDQQQKLREQAREPRREFVTRESHYLWGRRYLLTIEQNSQRTGIEFDHRRIVLSVRPGSPIEARARIMHEWHKSLLHAAVPELIEKWQDQLGVRVNSYFLQRMKTKWGSCNSSARNIRLNTELVKKPKDLLEYVIVHEMAHLIEPTHSERFQSLLDHHYRGWREARAELNELPLTAEYWRT